MTLEAFLEHAGLPVEYGGHLREFGVERVDDLMELSATGLQGMGIPDISGQVAAAHKTYMPESTLALAPTDDSDIKAKLAAILAPGGGPRREEKNGKDDSKPAPEARIEHATLNRATGPGRRKPTAKRGAVRDKPPAESPLGLLDPAPLTAHPRSSLRGSLTGTDTPRSQASKLSVWLAAALLEEIEPLLVENGVQLLDDLQELSKEDLEALGLEAAQLEKLWQCIHGENPVTVTRGDDGNWISAGGAPEMRGRQVTVSERFASAFTGKGRDRNHLSVSEKTPSRKGGAVPMALPTIEPTPRADGAPVPSRPASAPAQPRTSLLMRAKNLLMPSESLYSLRSKAEQGNCYAAMRAIELKPNVPDVQRWGFRALANAAEDNVSHRSQVVDVGGAAAAVRALRALRGSRPVEMQALRMLANLSSGDELCQMAVVDAGGLPEAVRLLEHEGTVTLVVQQALRTVANLACGTARVKRALLNAAVGSAVRKAMDAKAKDAATQRFGCAAYANLAGGEATAEGCRAMREAGGVLCVVRAMRGFAALPGVLSQATRALANLATGDDECVRAVRVGGAAWEEAVVDMGGAPSAATAMAAFPRHLEIVGWSLRTMGCVAAVDPESVRACGGVRAAVRAMQTHPKDAGVQAEALALLSAMAGADAASAPGAHAQTAVIEGGGAGMAVKAVKAFPEVVELLEQASMVLRNLARSSDSSGRRVVFDADGAAALQAAVRSHPDSATLKDNHRAVVEELDKVLPAVPAAECADEDEALVRDHTKGRHSRKGSAKSATVDTSAGRPSVRIADNDKFAVSGDV